MVRLVLDPAIRLVVVSLLLSLMPPAPVAAHPPLIGCRVWEFGLLKKFANHRQAFAIRSGFRSLFRTATTIFEGLCEQCDEKKKSQARY